MLALSSYNANMSVQEIKHNKIHEDTIHAADVFLWRNKKISASVLGGATVLWVFFELLEYHLLTLVCYVLILVFAILFLWSNASKFLNKSPPRIPEVQIPEDKFLQIAAGLRIEINQALDTLRNIASGKDQKKFIGVVVGLWVLSVVGSWCNFLTLFYISSWCNFLTLFYISSSSSRHTLSSANEKTILNDTSIVIPAATSSERQTRRNTNKKKKLDGTSLVITGATSSTSEPNLVVEGNNETMIITTKNKGSSSSRHTLSSANEKTILNDTSIFIPAATSSERQTHRNTNKKKKLDGTSLDITGATSSTSEPNLVVEGNNVKIIITINHQQTEITINPEQQTKITIINKHVVNAQTGRQETSNATKRLKSYHPHSLELKSMQSSYKCSGCKELGLGDRYECERCRYFLHPDCMYYEETTTHEFLKGSNFKFYKKPFHKKDRYCDACGMDILGFSYHCEITKKDLHPCCLNLKKTVVIGDQNFLLCEVLPSECWSCNSKKNKKKNYRDEGWCYSSKNQDCHFHVYCMKDQLVKFLNGGGGNGAMVAVNPRKVFNALKWVGKFLEVIFSLLTGNPIPFFTVAVETASTIMASTQKG